MKANDFEPIFDPIFLDFAEGVRPDDLAKAMEAQGHLIVAMLEKLTAGRLSDAEMSDYRTLLTELRFILMTQADPTRDDDNSAVYFDGTEVVTLSQAADGTQTASLFSELMNHEYMLGEQLYDLAQRPDIRVTVASPPMREGVTESSSKSQGGGEQL